MKKWGIVLLLLCVLAGCAGQGNQLDRVMALRAKLLGCSQCSFDAMVTADYGDELYTFGMHCTADNTGDLKFRVTVPETIAGITGTFTGEKGLLTFEDFALEFPRLTDDQITPVSGPWIFMKTLLGGYLTSCGPDGEDLLVTIHDSYAEDALTLEIWLDSGDVPIRGEILYDGRRIVTMDIENFTIS